MKSKAKIIVAGVVVAVVAVVTVVAGPFVARVANSAVLFSKGENVVTIPKVNEGFVPQGLAFYGEQATGTGRLYLSGYMADGGPSPVFACDVYDGSAVADAMTTTLLTRDGSTFTGHSGGISVDGDHVFICGDAKVNVFEHAAFDAALATGGQAQIVAVIDPGFGPAFAFVHDRKLYVGEFYREPEYPTPASHHMDVVSGKNHAVMYVYEQDFASETGYASKPCEVFSLPDLAQGACFDKEGRLLISCSWGLDASYILAYDLKSAAVGTFAVDGIDLPLTILDSRCEVARQDVPLFAEEIVIFEDRLLINSEAACNKYIVGKLYGADVMRSFDLRDFS